MTPKDFGRALRRALNPPRSGVGVKVTGGVSNDTIALTSEFRTPPEFPARILGATVDTTNRWSYTFEEVIKASKGYGQWATKGGGRTGTAFNRFEDMNDGTGVEGTGIDVDGSAFPDGFAIQPVPTNQIVMMRRVREASSPSVEYWFEFINAVDGSCDSPATDDLIIPGSVFPIWAEENQPLGAGATEWAYGNGADTPTTQGIPIPFNCELFKMTACLNAGSAGIDALKNGVTAGSISAVAGSTVATVGPTAFVSGDVLNFQTRTASGTGSPNTVCAWFRVTS